MVRHPFYRYCSGSFLLIKRHYNHPVITTATQVKRARGPGDILAPKVSTWTVGKP
jgi:hypothetical protein